MQHVYTYMPVPEEVTFDCARDALKFQRGRLANTVMVALAESFANGRVSPETRSALDDARNAVSLAEAGVETARKALLAYHDCERVKQEERRLRFASMPWWRKVLEVLRP